ncbi:hypothetical protein AB0J35_40845 [Nonomuraea angiospora]|uniref:hypothetical protein n=1 Tax=Nonomuraea angiospora TaxID=46172 RepID=UPI00343604B9
MLKKAVTYAHASIAPVNGQRVYGSPTPNATSGFIINSLLTEAQARGALAGFTWLFTGSLDTAGLTWNQTFGLGIPLGTDVLAVLLTLVDAGLIDIRMTGPRTLSAWRPGTVIFRDLTTGATPVELAGGRDIRAAPDVGTLEDLASAAYEEGVADEGRGAVERVQRTRELVFANTTRWLQLRDYLPGDRIYAPGEAGQRVKLRVRQITLTRTDRGVVGGNLVLDDRLADQEIRLRRRIAGMSIRP